MKTGVVLTVYIVILHSRMDGPTVKSSVIFLLQVLTLLGCNPLGSSKDQSTAPCRRLPLNQSRNHMF